VDDKKMLQLAEQFLGAWNTQEIDRVLACYTDDLRYRDPNTRGAVEGREAMARYLRKLFAGWRMRWSLREAHLFQGGEGCAVLWRGSFQRAAGGDTVEIDGMDLVLVQGERVARNEVYFDRARLAPLL
jgi:ketosteroid isomerase-like protein